MTALTASQIAKLNKMNRASQDVSLGTRISSAEASITAMELKDVVFSSSVVSAAQGNASAVILNSGLGSIVHFMVQHSRSGSVLHGDSLSKLYVVNASGSLTVQTTSGSLLPGDKVAYLAI